MGRLARRIKEGQYGKVFKSEKEVREQEGMLKGKEGRTGIKKEEQGPT